MEKIKQLRNTTGAGIVDCKKALEESGGNIEKAVEILRKKGIAKAAGRSGREANQGIIMISANESGAEGYIVEINSETDFVARNEQFQQFAEKILAVIKNNKPDSIEKLMKLEMDNSTVQKNLDNLSGIIGEKLDIKRYEILSGATVAAYSHMGGKIGVLVALDKTGEQELAHNIAMQIAAANPKYIAPDEVPAEEIEKEKEIYREQLLKEKKPENIIDKILSGKINKYFTEVCLIKQEYIKDDKKRIDDILGDIKVEKIVRYSL
ncbi:MAG: translation elongation factor Ts [Patescibacteria group bacterium]|nr:translation elongation factor Ts [Patescibacteria group bacterium]